PRVALAAAAEGTELVVLDARSDTEFVLRRPALRAIATGERWLPSHADPVVRSAIEAAARRDEAVRGVALAAGDPEARLYGPELVLVLALVEGLGAAEVDGVITRQRAAWGTVVAERVDSLGIRVEAAPGAGPGAGPGRDGPSRAGPGRDGPYDGPGRRGP
ncbi:MAG: hypothetical protein QM635_12255, partial [Microbacteriaceae bacterium]